jgi:hypothetical protein
MDIPDPQGRDPGGLPETQLVQENWLFEYQFLNLLSFTLSLYSSTQSFKVKICLVSFEKCHLIEKIDSLGL